MSERLNAYPAYKDSSVEWLGRIPAQWQAIRLKWLVSKIGSGKTPKGGGQTYINSGVLFLRSQNVHFDGLQLDDVVHISDSTDSEMASTRIRRGDVLLNITGASLGRCSPVPDNLPPANVSQHVCILRPRDGRVLQRYLTRSLASKFAQTQIFADEVGTSREGLAYEQIANLVLSVPVSLDEQRAIDEFLDRETGKIEALVAKKERLIELLQEKRTTLISHAVTKGLNPNAPVKDSSIPWLGQIPTHWSCAPVYARYEVQLGKMLDGARITGERLAPYLRNVDVQWGRVVIENLPQMDFSPADKIRFSLKVGDLLVCEGGEVGRAAFWQGELPECYYQKALHRLRPFNHDSDDPRFMFYALFFTAKLGVFAAGGNPNTIDHLTAENLRKHRFAFPPGSEQTTVAEFLDRETAKLDALIAKVRKAIEMLQEYRTALISAAVTGQIDVRQSVSCNRGKESLVS